MAATNRVVLVAVEVTVETHPVHFSAFQDLVLSYDGNDVFHVAGYDAGVAAHAAGHVNGHTPARSRVFCVREEREEVAVPSFILFDELRMLWIFLIILK